MGLHMWNLEQEEKNLKLQTATLSHVTILSSLSLRWQRTFTSHCTHSPRLVFVTCGYRVSSEVISIYAEVLHPVSNQVKFFRILPKKTKCHRNTSAMIFVVSKKTKTKPQSKTWPGWIHSWGLEVVHRFLEGLWKDWNTEVPSFWE